MSYNNEQEGFPIMLDNRTCRGAKKLVCTCKNARPENQEMMEENMLEVATRVPYTPYVTGSAYSQASEDPNNPQDQVSNMHQGVTLEELLEAHKQKSADKGLQNLNIARLKVFTRKPKNLVSICDTEQSNTSDARKVDSIVPDSPVHTRLLFGKDVSLDLVGYKNLTFNDKEIILTPYSKPSVQDVSEPARSRVRLEMVPYPRDWPWYWSRHFPNSACRVAGAERRKQVLLMIQEAKKDATKIYCTPPEF
jgi:hypothetical protein